MEEHPGLLPYFDGSTTNASGIAYSWEGTIGASASVAKAGVIEVRRNLLSTPRGSLLWVRGLGREDHQAYPSKQALVSFNVINLLK